ncbi:hypothetical protein BDF22DRAFT_689499 [Syncephalis plumigaleata]|nr:hypothetical protein BDF22DRAFT_689499 [Syncephalis plumigaleata]
MSIVDRFCAKSDGARVLRRASAAQIEVTWRNVVEQWGQGITYEQFLQRERLLSEQPGFTGDKMSFWVLVPASDPDTLEPLAHCESFDRTSILVMPGDNDESPIVKHVRCWSIASVFCPEKFRNRGYASELMALLRREAERTGITLSTLVSDVGAEFYARFGWHVYPSVEASFPAKSGDIALSNIEMLTETDIASVASADANELQARAMALMDRSTDDTPIAALLPSEANYRWHWARTQFYAQIESMHPKPTVMGAILVDDTGRSIRNHIIWHHDLPKKITRVLRFCCESVEVGQQLIAAAQNEAYSLGLNQVIVWLSQEDDREATILQRLADCTETTRNDCLPSLAWFNVNDHADNVNLRWLACDRYIWT